MIRNALPFLLAMTVSFAWTQLSRADTPEPIDFNRDIRPILSENCFKCHGPDEEQRRAKLRLDTKEGAFADRRGSKAIVPGDLKKSVLVERIESKDEFEVMPPPKSGKSLKPEQIALIKAWIKQGATWEDHWAFVTPKRPALPKVANKNRANNPIDYYILARLEKMKLTLSDEADRRTLIRRVTLDLTGLPPTPAEVNAFVNDKSTNAYEKLVDRLLASTRYGEHQARFWLDAARYGDTHGLHLDNYREIWPYREWVINAYNKNLPYDRFIIEQLAGDLLPNPSRDQLVATGFNRAHVTTNEGGSIREEVFVRNVVDRVETTGTVMMGLTVGCAVCHDHKYDPITQKEFYQMFAYFNSLDGSPLDGNSSKPAPVLSVPSQEQKQQLDAYEKQIAQWEKEVADFVAKYQYKEPAKPQQPKLPDPEEYVWIDDDLPVGAKPSGPWYWVNDPKPVLSGKKSSTETASGQTQHYFTGAKPLTVGKGDKLFAYVYLDPKKLPKEIMLQWNDGKWEHRAFWGADVIPFGRGNGPQHRRMGDLPKAGEWVRLEVNAAHVGLKPGAKINGWAFTQHGGTVYWDKAGIVHMPDPSKLKFDSLAQWQEYQKKNKFIGTPKAIQNLIKAKKRNPAQEKELTEYFVKNVYIGTRDKLQPQLQKIKQTRTKMANMEKQFPTTLIWKETKQPRQAYFLKRGQYDARGDKVQRNTPSMLPPMAKDLPKNRLGLAKWLVSAEHPLTSRVAVNRYWQQFFGTGLVVTSEDFGNQGARPSHPKLLDWLSVEFRESGWDIKKLHKLIVMSATYRQSSKVTPELYKADPQNRFLARGPRVRLDAEMIRDQALFVSDLLVEKIGGPSVKPPQPSGLWFAVGYSGSNTVRFKKDTGPDKVYRRSLYTFWKRTSPPPQMDIFDAPSRESCKVRRERTNTPLQALMLMNDPQFVEASRSFGERIMKRKGSVEERVRFAFETATARPPSELESEILTKTYHKFLKRYQSDTKAAQQLVRIGETPPEANMAVAELASWTMVGNVILNLDEVIMKN